jgi:membrane protease YdiL (CAAX protease family)
VNTPEESAPQEPAQTLSARPNDGPKRALSERLLELIGALVTWLVSVGLLFLPQILALPYLIYHYQGRQITPDVLLADKTLIVLLVSGILPAHLITLGIALAVVTRFGKVPVKEALGWYWTNRLSIVKTIGLGVVLFVLAWGVTVAFGGKETDLEIIIRSSRAAALIVAFLAVATAPLVEEIIYRGILFPAWQQLSGSTIAVIVVTLSFAIPHIPQYRQNLAVIASITVLSLVLTIVRARTGRLLPCYIIHLVFNGIQAVLIALETLLRPPAKTPPPDVASSFVFFLRGIL